jgi:hypothetical protein
MQVSRLLSPTLWRWWTGLQVRISTCNTLMVRYECVCTQFVTVHTIMFTVCTGMYLVCTKTLNRQVQWTSGCGSFKLDVASLAWLAWQSRSLQRGRMLPAKHQTSVGRKMVNVAKAMEPGWNEVWVWTAWVLLYITSTYRNVLVCTKRCWKVERRHTGDFGLWEVKLGVLKEYMVVPKQTNTG